MKAHFDVVIAGGGHAGIEAASACARMGCATALVSMEIAAIGRMSCNPAIGGVAKGQLVRDIDSLGGLMGEFADQAGIQFRMLNRSKGPAVWGPRAQMDMDRYSLLAQCRLKATANLNLIESELLDFRCQDDLFDLTLAKGETVRTRSLVITSGTFLGAVMYTGLHPTQGGRIGERAAEQLAVTLKNKGLRTRRLKTGTPARLDKKSIDFSQTTLQPGDEEPVPFSFRTTGVLQNNAVCWIAHTNRETHDILREGFAQSPMFTGAIQGLGPRYCPSIEDKVERFSDRDAHQLFLEPEGPDNDRIYVNGFSSSLPAEVQKRALQSIPGLGHCHILRYGYAVEYDAIDATQLDPTYQTRLIPGLYFAGQVCGTSGYEEAAAQGLMAGINAALQIRGEEPFLLARSESYIGVLTDDLVSIDLPEPYRMFTSRAEYRLHLRQDNAEERLLMKGVNLGLVDGETLARYETFQSTVGTVRDYLSQKFSPEALNRALETMGSSQVQEGGSALELLRRPEVGLEGLLQSLGYPESLSPRELLHVQASERYRGFYKRQQREIERNQRLSGVTIPSDFVYEEASALSLEARQVMAQKRPLTIGHAQSLHGVTSADVSALVFYLTRR